MSAATFVLEDENGLVACKVSFSSDKGGFDAESHAHQHAQILIKMMDKICSSKEVAQEKEQTKQIPRILLA
jgi:hypothetical protein